MSEATIAITTETAKDPRVALGFTVARADAKTAEQFHKVIAPLCSADALDAFKEARKSFHMGYVAYRLNTKAGAATVDTVTRAAEILRTKTAERSPEDARAYGASRSAFSRMLEVAGLESPENRGGNNNPEGFKKDAQPSADAQSVTASVSPDAPVSAPETAKYTTVTHGHKYLSQCAATMLATMDKHAPAFDSNLRKMVQDFAKHLEAYVIAE
jgi:hypothetical protein